MAQWGKYLLGKHGVGAGGGGLRLTLRNPCKSRTEQCACNPSVPIARWEVERGKYREYTGQVAQYMQWWTAETVWKQGGTWESPLPVPWPVANPGLPSQEYAHTYTSTYIIRVSSVRDPRNNRKNSHKYASDLKVPAAMTVVNNLFAKVGQAWVWSLGKGGTMQSRKKKRQTYKWEEVTVTFFQQKG